MRSGCTRCATRRGCHGAAANRLGERSSLAWHSEATGLRVVYSSVRVACIVVLFVVRWSMTRPRVVEVLFVEGSYPISTKFRILLRHVRRQRSTTHGRHGHLLDRVLLRWIRCVYRVSANGDHSRVDAISRLCCNWWEVRRLVLLLDRNRFPGSGASRSRGRAGRTRRRLRRSSWAPLLLNWRCWWRRGHWQRLWQRLFPWRWRLTKVRNKLIRRS